MVTLVSKLYENKVSSKNNSIKNLQIEIEKIKYRQRKSNLDDSSIEDDMLIIKTNKEKESNRINDNDKFEENIKCIMDKIKF